MKALSLPFNVIVIILIVALVALGVITFFVSGWNPSAISLQAHVIKSVACLNWNCGRTGLASENIKVSIDVGTAADNKDDNLKNLCKDYYKDDDCKKVCNC